MVSLGGQRGWLIALAATSGVALIATFVLAPAGPAARPLITAVAWTGSSAVALLACALAWRQAATAEPRPWLIVGLGCGGVLAGQLVADYCALARPIAPWPARSLTAIGHLSLYLALAAAWGGLLRPTRRRAVDPDVALDTGLVVYTAGALIYAFLIAPVASAAPAPHASLAALAPGAAGAGVLLLVLILLVRRPGVVPGRWGLLLGGSALFALADILRTLLDARDVSPAGGLPDLGGSVGLLTIAYAAARAPGHAAPARSSAARGSRGRTLGIPLALAGIGGIAIEQAVSPERDIAAAALVAVGVVLVGARFVYSLRTDRRYAELLESEVASQTRSLMDSLAGTAAAERNLRLVIEAVPDAVAVLDREGSIVEANEPAKALSGIADPVGHTVFEFLDPTASAVVREKLAAAFHGAVQRFETPFRRADGSRGLAALLYAPVREGGAIPRILALARDITDQKRTEAQLQQAEKLTAMGQLVSGVAHEINNPAAIISGFAQTLLLEEQRPEPREILQMICDEATRIGRITANLLAFARAGGKQRTLVDLNDIVRRTFALRSYHLSTLNIAVALELDAGEPKIWADASELQQLLLNLLINAEQALVTVETPRTITVRTRTDDQTVGLEVADSGPGIPAAVRHKIFDPFFTTKPEGVGTGLGLSICYGIAQEHGGRIVAESEPGHGARFLLTLPREPRAEVRLPVAAAPAAARATGTLSVLVVDDETALRNALLRFLGRRGIRSQGVADGAEALGVLRRAEFDVIVSDVRMPGMSGREFLQHLRRDRPELVSRLVFTTGDTFAPDTAALIAESGIPAVTKPFDFAALEQVIREVAARHLPARPRASA